MNEIRQRLKNLRMELLRRNLDAWYISGTDPHSSEYLPARWQTRKYISGFTGSYGVVVVAQEEAALWTDSRYFIQAEEQLKGSGIKMLKLRVPEAVPPEAWLVKKLSAGSKVGFDPQTLSLAGYRKLADSLQKKGILAVETPDLFEKIWEERPELPGDPIYEPELDDFGLSRKEKYEMLISRLRKNEADLQVVTALDELAWLFNLRGSDIAYNPLFLGYGIVGKNEWMLFVDLQKLPPELKLKLEKDKIKVMPYDSIFSWLKGVSERKIHLDPSSASFAVYSHLHSGNTIVEGISPVSLMKMCKNQAELSGFKEAMKKDGIALVEFLYWLKQNVGSTDITEFTAGEKLDKLRAERPGFQGPSFASIFGYMKNGAVVHYCAQKELALGLKDEGILLFDSGGHYNNGTTDVTRTISLGIITPDQMADYTRVLKGMIALSTIRFPEGTKGCNLDVVARLALWMNGLNYGHGTSHGIGHFLNVHESPVSIRQECSDIALEPGMVLSNEPGLYREGQYGIRIENMMVCVEKEVTEFGKFLGFETLTLCPIDTKLVDLRMLNAEEKEWLNEYHLTVRNALSPLLPAHHKAYLVEITQPI